MRERISIDIYNRLMHGVGTSLQYDETKEGQCRVQRMSLNKPGDLAGWYIEKLVLTPTSGKGHSKASSMNVWREYASQSPYACTHNR